MTRPRRSKRAGFTLLELLVALALLAITGAGLASAMRLGTETYTRARTLGSDNGHAAARAQLRRLIERATPQTLLTPFPKEFTGTTDSLDFVTLAPLGFARDAAGLRVQVALAEGNLMATLQPFDDDGTNLRQYRATIAEGVTTASFTYFSNGEWVESWTDSANLPDLVRIQLDDPTTEPWPEFTVELIYAN